MMNKSLSCLPIALLVFLSGCVHYVFNRTTHNVAPARGAGCDFEIFMTRPDREYVELGLLDVGGDVTAAPHSVAKFRVMVADSVCAAGGDAVIAQVNGFGGYVHGAVIKFR